MTPEGIEPPIFGSGIRRVTIAPWSQAEKKVHSAGFEPARTKSTGLKSSALTTRPRMLDEKQEHGLGV
jgi:hypothetical protein